MSGYKTIVCDPPWPERGGGRCKRGADRHYKLMSVREIAALPVRRLADPTGCTLEIAPTDADSPSPCHRIGLALIRLAYAVALVSMTRSKP